jgi:hypothetical protein
MATTPHPNTNSTLFSQRHTSKENQSMRQHNFTIDLNLFFWQVANMKMSVTQVIPPYTETQVVLEKSGVEQ